MDDHNFIAKANLDWTESNQRGLFHCLRAAYNLTSELISPDQHAAFGTPNRNHFRGMGRWVFVDYSLEMGCRTGILNGISAEWVPLCGSDNGVHVLELRGKYCSLSAHHLNTPDVAPRDSSKRREKRFLNQIQPSFDFGDFQETSDNSPLQILLVHGHQNLNFAYLRAYTDPDVANSFVRLSSNLSVAYGSDLYASEAEEVREVQMGVKEILRKSTGTQG